MTADEPSMHEVVIGAEFAAARRAEASLRGASPAVESPLGVSYDFWAGETDLARFVDSRIDAEIGSMVNRAAGQTAESRLALQTALTLDDFYSVLTFTRRSAVRTLRLRDVGPATEGLLAIGLIDLGRVDWRDVPIATALAFYALRRAGASALDGLRAVNQMAQPALRDLLAKFKDFDNGKTLRRWGYEEVVTRYGPGFVQRGSDRFKPRMNLVDIAIAVADAIDLDAYRTSDVTLANPLPAVWFPKTTRIEVERILGRAFGGVTVHARARPAQFANAESQQFTVFLIETRNEAAASRLVSLANDHCAPSHAALSLHSERLFLLVIARSFVSGVAGHESADQLQRFRNPFLAALQRPALADQS